MLEVLEQEPAPCCRRDEQSAATLRCVCAPRMTVFDKCVPDPSADAWKQLAGSDDVTSISIHVVRHEHAAPTIDAERERSSVPRIIVRTVRPSSGND
jgi:hypothetical protein